MGVYILIITYQPKAFHIISPSGRDSRNIVKGRIRLPVRGEGIFLKRLEDLPPPFPIDRVPRYAPHEQQTFHRLGPLEVMRIERFDDVILLPALQGIHARLKR